MNESKPTLIVTLGDPAGIGPEVTATALCEPEIQQACRIIIAGDPDLLDRACNLKGKWGRVEFEPIDRVPEAPSLEERGAYLYAALKKGVEFCLEGKADGLVTAPISKAALAAAGHNYPGHTEALGELCDASPVMMLVGGPLRVVPLTTHCPLRDVPDRLTGQTVYDTCLAVARALVRDFGIETPRLALAGLNPHAGEGGLFGNEESDILNPAVEKLMEKGVDISGAIPADTAFYRAAQGEFDAVMAPTHDQALIPVKLMAFESTVNVTLNLPIVRTSPGHGTAEDIAWQGKANPASMIEAMKLAVLLAKNRKQTR